MKKFFQRVSTKGEAPPISSFGNLMTFYSLLFFLICIPFVLIVALVWLTGVIGFSTWIIAAVVVLMGLVFWRIYRKWGQIKAQMAAHGAEVKDIVKDATKTGKDVEVTFLNGLLTFRYGNRTFNQGAIPQLAPPPLALEAPDLATVAPLELSDSPPPSDPAHLRQELEGFIRLRDSGVITSEEFDTIKNRLLENFTGEPFLTEASKL